MALPMVAGHECAGVVEAVGEGVTRVKVGDHVVGTWMIPCGQCPQCRAGHGNVCTGTFTQFVSGTMLDGTTRYTDAEGKQEQVHGPGVVGEQPRLEPGESFEYTSGCRLATPRGSMQGSYEMWRDDGRKFDVEIASFALEMPHTLH